MELSTWLAASAAALPSISSSIGTEPIEVAVVLKELGLPYEIHCFKYEDVKSLVLSTSIRTGKSQDPNTQLTLCESGAIIQYLIGQYDKDHKLGYEALHERHPGQSPYYGQGAWFSVLQPEKIPSAIKRYTNEAHRILGVLNTALEGRTWLVGDRCTFADLAFLPWNERMNLFLFVPRDEILSSYPMFWIDIPGCARGSLG
ncbi:uncharacterized protein BDV17DRAFT_301396 [Aspergillus undulatus]|uniref:uncharacterized protein n=1 Tax=Aspergillus undulatus TaxID=1810928 RepID=UPI003CCE50FF